MQRFGLIIIIVFWCNFIFGQANDAELWTGVAIRKKVTKKIAGKLEQQLRLNDNISSTKSIFTDLGLSFRFSKRLKVSGNYRFINRGRSSGNYWISHRFYGDFRYSYKANPIMFIYRNRFCTEVGQEENGRIRENYERNKLEIKLDLNKRFMPFFSSELYYFVERAIFDKVRYTTGIDLNLKNRNELSLFYRIQREMNVVNPDYSYIVGVGFSHNLKGRLIKDRAND